ncbi:SH3 domain-containing protein [Celeribacter arenosi]
MIGSFRVVIFGCVAMIAILFSGGGFGVSPAVAQEGTGSAVSQPHDADENVGADEGDEGDEPERPARGSVTNLPLPRFVSLKANEANVRRGPSLSHRIDWVFTRRGTPLEVIAEYGHWRRVRDNDGAVGWLHYSLISGVRMALVEAETVDLHARPDPTSPLNAHAEKGVILRLLSCKVDWCRVSADGYKGWVTKVGLWGIGADEVLE